MIANYVNQSWITVREGIDFANRLRFKKFSAAAGNLKPMVDVIARFVFGQRINMITYRYSLPDRFVALFTECFVEFTLSHKKDIYEFSVVLLNIRQEPYLLNKFMIKPLGLIDD